MPTQAVRAEYALWLATPPVEGMLVETMEFNSIVWPVPIRIANAVEEPFRAFGEDGVLRDYSPLAFVLDRPAIRNSTELMVNARVDGVDGTLLQAFAGLSVDQLRQPVSVVVRVFIWPTMLDRPVWAAPLRFRLEEAKVAIDQVNLTLVGGRLPTKRAGRYYGLDRFVGLRPY